MDIHTNIPLKNYLTMKLGGNARFMANASTPEDIAQLYKNAKDQNLSVVVLGGGSNLLATDEGFNGLIIRNNLRGVDILEDTPSTTTIKFAAGENWDEAVALTVERGLIGIEALSSIPGTVGAAPVQNIGAYGQELADTFVSLEAYDSVDDRFITLSAEECGFAYRHSIFRGKYAGRYAITSVTLQLFKSAPQPPFYKALEDYFTKNSITLFTPKVVRDAVSEIRADKLPDPKIKPNSGSFFKNAIVEKWHLDELLKEYPDMPHFDFGDKTYKVPTGWLIENAGFKGKLINGMRVNDKNCLVLINEAASSYKDLLAARDEIIGAVRDKYRVAIEQEPLLI
jgi:UDP-N-acetylmuramate dehydrogenase